MSLFGSLMGDFDDDLGLGSHMNAINMQMRSMNRLMNSFMPDPFNMLTPFDSGFQQNQLMERNQNAGMGGLFPGFPAIPNINRLLNTDIAANGGNSYCSSSVITMSSGPDGRPQIYQATSSSKTGPGGIRETRKTVQDSRTGLKKMAIGHHIGERAHIIEKEQDLRSGQLEERQEFINLDEEEAEEFDHEFTQRATRGMGRVGGAARAIHAAPNSTLTIEPVDSDEEAESRGNHRYMHALPAPPTASATAQQPNSAARTATTTAAAAVAAAAAAATTTNAANATDTATAKAASSPERRTTNAAELSHSNVNVSSNSSVNNNNNYLSTVLPRRNYHYRGHLVLPRRPLRTPFSSPLTTTPITTSLHNITASSSAGHMHHPYNNVTATPSGGRRQQRKQGSKSSTAQSGKAAVKETAKHSKRSKH